MRGGELAPVAARHARGHAPRIYLDNGGDTDAARVPLVDLGDGANPGYFWSVTLSLLVASSSSPSGRGTLAPFSMYHRSYRR